jgi:hypothetical protein
MVFSVYPPSILAWSIWFFPSYHGVFLHGVHGFFRHSALDAESKVETLSSAKP